MDPETREKVKRFHQNVTFLGGLLMVAASLAGAYITFFRTAKGLPSFLVTLARWVSGR